MAKEQKFQSWINKRLSVSILLNVTHGPTISKWTHIETCHKENFSEQSIAEIASQIHKTSPSTFAIWSFVKPINYILWEQTKQNPNFDFCLAKALWYLFKSHSLLTNPILHFAIAPQSDCEIRWLDMSSWGSKKAFAISLCLATVPTSVPGNQKTLDVGLFLKVLNKDPNIWLCVNKGLVQATASNHFLPTVHSPAAKSLYNLGCKQWICTSTYKIECVCRLYYNLKYLEVPICWSKLVRSQFSPRKHQDWWPAPAASFDCQIDSVANWCVFATHFLVLPTDAYRFIGFSVCGM